MRYNVAQLLKEPVGFQWDLQVNEEVLIEAGVRERVVGHVRLTRFNRGVWAKAGLDVEVDESCGRCLSVFRLPVHVCIDERARPSGPAEAENGELVIDRDGALDLRETLRQYLILNRPVKAVCQSDCKGICALCGGDKNLSPCQCQERPVEPRWAKLAALGSRRGG